MKSKPLILREQANRDVEEIVACYLSEATETAGLGLIDALGQAYALISLHPTAGPPRYAYAPSLPGLWAWQLARYPHLVFYVEQAGQINVWRVLHTQRDIPAWMQEPEAG